MCREKYILFFNSLPFLTVLRLFAGIRTKLCSAEYELEGQAKFKCYKVVNLLSLSLTKNSYLWFGAAAEQPYTEEMNLSKCFLAWEHHESWLLTRFLLALGLAELKIFLEKEIIQISAIMGSSKARTFRGRVNQDEKAEDFDLGKKAFNSNICHIW